MTVQYVFNVYSNNKLDRVVCKTEYKPLWQMRQELETEYRKVNDIKGSIILECIAFNSI